MWKHLHVAHSGLLLFVLVLVGLPGDGRALPQEKDWLHSVQEDVAVLGDIWPGSGGWLGVSLADVTPDKVKELKLPAERGALLTEVDSDSPAAKAGLKNNDVVTEFNGQRVESAAQFRRLVSETPAGRTVQLTIWRDGRAQNISVPLGDHFKQMERRFHVATPGEFHFRMPDFGYEFWSPSAPVLGIDAEDLSGQLGSYFGAPDGEGVLVREVRPNSPAEKAGLKAGDVITKIDDHRIHNIGELRERIRAKKDNKTMSVGVLRKGSELSMKVEVEAPRPPAPRRLISHRALQI